MKIRTMNYYMAEAFTSFRRNSFMSIASVATVALALFILGLFSMLAANLDYFADNLENQVELSVYLKDDLTTDQVMAVGYGQDERTYEGPAGYFGCIGR